MDISPFNQNIDHLFSSTVYHIDFYQRDYKWSEEPVKRLLNDIFYKFEESYLLHTSVDASKEAISAHYPWYYLNTYVTNTIDGRVYVVDGQQRLTTLTLILIKLRHLAIGFSPKAEGWLKQKIAGHSGFELEFWMHHASHLKVLEALYDDENDVKNIDVSSGVTAVNMVDNYQIISTYLNKKLPDKHKFETFVFYFLERLVLIKLAVEQTDVPMVFEVINDRGVRLHPYEILKGKLLGQIDKIEMDKDDYNGLWEKQVGKVNAFKDDEIDAFFRYYLKAKYTKSRKEGQRFDGGYHREMFKQDMIAQLNLEHDPGSVKKFIKDTLRYYTDLYAKIWKLSKHQNSNAPSVFFNSLNEMDGQFLLILSACELDDAQEAEKVRMISFELDRLFTLLQLQNSYDSNEFATRLSLISNEIREQPVDVIHTVFDKHLIEILSDRRAAKVDQPFSYTYFKNASIEHLNKRFVRYFFARVDQFIADGTSVKMRHPLSDLVSKSGAKTGFHVEHILSRNAENQALFNNDEERFEQERNRLGGILLLKGRDNISSNNEVYTQKLKSYATTLYWNETLRPDTYKSKLDLKAFMEKHNLDFRPLDTFGPVELEYRQKLLFDISSLIWC
ncbi:Uncharacterized conserved protein, contains ParB-like and HNH nuclease domains [Desulfuromusa kysingii]|uniref:Uncharacterized conserved protein, contains ParB-like and HNH nuclease domains n=1 Tax=Desulfuromusa kysingii TaxID=37625 RepID=A0A1H3YZC8_9BACT|nr:DUF262 domain-containing protein [Desulfuromusa kysingii]SEA16511.1 Uncharacterized conserved protein, contains ParB-like and HNH nuclease domains [Desulfuromusa kysingii]